MLVRQEGYPAFAVRNRAVALEAVTVPLHQALVDVGDRLRVTALTVLLDNFF
jgi:hypothetical protein